MIDEKKLFEFIKEYSYPITQFSNSIDIGMTLAGIKQAIDEQPKIGEWVPCSERLPEENGKYICTQERYDVSGKRLISKSVELVDFHDGIWRRASFLKIIAWKPLPEPYEGA